MPPTSTAEAPSAVDDPAKVSSAVARRTLVTGALRFARRTWIVAAAAVIWVVARARPPRRSEFPDSAQEWYKEKGEGDSMDTAVRPEAATEVEAGCTTILRGEEAEGFLMLLERSKAFNPAKKAYLEEAVAFSDRMLLTGRLPD